MFDRLTDLIKAKGKGVHAYEAAADAAREAAAAEPEAAAAFALLAGAMQAHAARAYGEPTTVAEMDAHFAAFSGVVAALDAAWAQPDPAVRLAALNDAASKLAGF